MVALEVAPDLLEKMPFAMGEIISVEGDQLVVWWYGNAHGNVLGAWRSGYFQPGDNRRYYSDKRLHSSHPRYTSVTSETQLSVSDVIGTSFRLNRRNALPRAVLKAVSNRPNVPWTLPQEDIALLEAVDLQASL
jgi:hypothetical protein